MVHLSLLFNATGKIQDLAYNHYSGLSVNRLVKLYEMRTVILTMLVAILGMSCQDNEPLPTPEPASGIYHVILDEPAFFHYLKPYEIDLNGDSLYDFRFSVGLVYSDGSSHEKFLANSYRDAKIQIIDYAAVAYDKDFVVGPQGDLGNTIWDIFSGELLVKTTRENQAPVWSGNWMENSEGYIAVSIRLNGEYHYGWVKLLADVEQDAILVQEYAFNKAPGESIKTGQRE